MMYCIQIASFNDTLNEIPSLNYCEKNEKPVNSFVICSFYLEC